MKYLTAYYTDQGKRKGVNQDSLLVSQAEYQGQAVLLAAVCDGMGGLQKGEMASAEVIRSFEEWFRKDLEILVGQEEFEDVLYDSWETLLQEVHGRLWRYAQLHGIRMGTTLTAMLFWQEEYYIAHVGDTRIYEIKEQVTQLTGDQVLAQLNDACGNRKIQEPECRAGLGHQQSRNSGIGKPGYRKKESQAGKNVLLQGIGCSPAIRPAYYSGKVEKDTVYLLCTDGFRHKLSKEELRETFMPETLINETVMSERGKYIAGLVMERGERDNITAIILRTS